MSDLSGAGVSLAAAAANLAMALVMVMEIAAAGTASGNTNAGIANAPTGAGASIATTGNAASADATTANAATAGTATAGTAMPQAAPGVNNPQRDWQNWTLNCQGCHRPDGTGSEGTAPSLAGTVSKFLTVPGGREYLGRVPGVATSPLSNADLADLMNWMFWRFDREHLPTDFTPFTAPEIGRLRVSPLRLEASQMRSALLQKADALQATASK